MTSTVVPQREEHPGDLRLDGARTGGRLEPAGYFRYRDRTWVVHLDTHYEPLLLAYGAMQAGDDPFVERETQSGRCLELRPELQARLNSPHKYLYIY